MQSRGENGAWDVRNFASLEEAAPSLRVGEGFVLGLPVTAVLAQRLQLPTVAGEDFAEMVRIQIEKALPYPAEELTSDFEVVERTEETSVVAAVAVHNARLEAIAAPLISRGLIPTQVTVYAAQRAATHAATGRAFLLYPENETLVCGISEEGQLSFTRTLDSADPVQLRMDLPQLALTAELQGINTSFPVVLLDESLFELRGTVQELFAGRADLIAIETPPAPTKLNLLPASWRARSAQIVKAGEWRKRLLWAGGIYAAVVLFFIAYVLFLRFQVGRLQTRITRDAPQTEFVKASAATWKSLAPAIDQHFYPVEVLLHLFECLPSPDVRITEFKQSARQISVDGEANSTALAYQFADKVKKHADLQTFIFEMTTPRILPNEHAQFRLEGKPR